MFQNPSCCVWAVYTNWVGLFPRKLVNQVSISFYWIYEPFITPWKASLKLMLSRLPRTSMTGEVAALLQGPSALAARTIGSIGSCWGMLSPRIKILGQDSFNLPWRMGFVSVNVHTYSWVKHLLQSVGYEFIHPTKNVWKSRCITPQRVPLLSLDYERTQ